MFLRSDSPSVCSAASWLVRASSVSADSRQLLANLSGNHAIGAHGSARHQHLRVLRSHLADARGFATQRMRPQRLQSAIGGLGRHKEHRLSLVGNVHGIKSQQFAGRLHLAPHRQTWFVDLDADVRSRRDFVESRCEAAAGGIAHSVYPRPNRIENSADHAVQRRAIGTDLAFEFEPLAHAHDRHTVVADGARDKYDVANLRTLWTHADSRPQQAYASSIDVTAVAVPAFNYLRISCDDVNPGSRGSIGHGACDRGQLRQRKAFFEDEACTEELRLGTGDGKIVDRPVHGKRSDRSTGKEEWLYDERVRAHRDLPGAQIEERGIAEILESRIAKSRKKQVLDELVAKLAATTVPHHDGRIIGQRQGTRPVCEVGHTVRKLSQLRSISHFADNS